MGKKTTTTHARTPGKPDILESETHEWCLVLPPLNHAMKSLNLKPTRNWHLHKQSRQWSRREIQKETQVHVEMWHMVKVLSQTTGLFNKSAGQLGSHLEKK